MSRSFAFLPGAARYGGNVVDLWHRVDALSPRQPSLSLIRNLVSALCAPFARARPEMRGQVISVSGSGPLGIDIALCLHHHTCTLWLSGWHDEMPDIDVALEYVARAIDGRLRLKVECAAGHRPRKWIVECQADDGTWIEEAFTCGVRMCWSRAETTIYLRNAFSPARSGARTGPAAWPLGRCLALDKS